MKDLPLLYTNLKPGEDKALTAGKPYSLVISGRDVNGTMTITHNEHGENPKSLYGHEAMAIHSMLVPFLYVPEADVTCRLELGPELVYADLTLTIVEIATAVPTNGRCVFLVSDEPLNPNVVLPLADKLGGAVPVILFEKDYAMYLPEPGVAFAFYVPSNSILLNRTETIFDVAYGETITLTQREIKS